MSFSLAQLLRSALRPVDPRGDEEIARDLEDEFRFHIDELMRELTAEGLERDAAALQAHERFGDIDRYRRECHLVARKERIMLQRINLILMVVVLLVVVCASVQMFVTQRHNTLALQAITVELTTMRAAMNADARAGERDAAGPRNDQAVEGIITLEGDLTRSGIYQLPRHSRLNVLQLIAASGGLEGRPAESLRIRLIRGHEVEAVTESFRYVDLTANPRLVPVLLPGDRVIVETDESGA